MCKIQIKSLCTNEAPDHILTLYSFRVYYQVGVAMGGLWLALDQDQPKGFLSVFRWISVRGCLTKMLGPLVNSVPLEFSRFPAMLSPLKTTLFPVPALTPPGGRLESAYAFKLRYTDCKVRLELSFSC